MILLLIIHLISQSYNPTLCGLGSSHFARRYFGNLVWFLFPGYLDGSLHPVWLYYPILFRYVVHPKMWVTPFGDPRINVYVLLPVAFRSLSRPSSPYSSIGIRHRPIFAWPYYSFRLSLIPCAFSPHFIQAWNFQLVISYRPSLIFRLISYFFLHYLFQRPALKTLSSFSLLENKGFEPLTLGLQSRCSSQLS